MASVFDIPEFKAGQDVRDMRDQLNRLRRAILALQPCDSSDIKPALTERGTTFRIAKRISSSSAPAHPFKVVDASTTGPDEARVRVIFGQVNSVTPEIATVPLDDDPAPTIEVITGVVYLELTLDVDGNVTAVEVANDTTLPASDSTHAYITLATVTVASDAVTAINQSVTQSLQFLRCNDNDIFGSV